MLKPITIPSIYNGPLPARMAKCAPDMAAGLALLEVAVAAKGGTLVLSDLFRSHDMQLQAHLDYTSGKKKAYSPAPGGGMHEAGRAMDIDIEALKPITLAEFWDIAQPLGFHPIIDTPSPSRSECWHFDFRGSFQLVYDYQQAHPTPGMLPYTRMASLAILEQDIPVDEFGTSTKALHFYIQSALVRLGAEIGAIDGILGAKCQAALASFGYPAGAGLDAMLECVRPLLQAKYPSEYC